jgi:hypothetical protein
MKDQMAQYLNFEEVAAELKCSLAKVRQLVLEDKSLKATRITPNGMVLPPSSPDDSLVCNLDFTSHVSDAGAISADDYGRDATGKTVLIQTLDAGFLRIERADLDIFITASDWYTKTKIGLPTSSAGPWPWGAHHTELLGHLDAAAQKFWVHYDPANAKATAPKNDTVVNWLETERRVSHTVAVAMATILRIDGLPTGPRK